MKKIVVIPALLLLTVLLAACGGGGGGGNNSSTNPAALADLELSAGALDQIFQSSQFDYTSTVGYLATETTVTPTTADAAATVTVNGAAVASGSASDPIPLAVGANTITVIVTASDGVTTNTYTVTVTRESAAQFAQRAYIKASNTDSDANFGYSVALSGDTLAVGAPGEASNARGINGDQGDTSAPNAGAVYVFTRSGTTWSQQAYVKASNTQQNYAFGVSVALDGDTLAVGSTGEASNAEVIDGDQNNTLAPGAGAVYVFIRSGTTWTQQAYVKASNTDSGDNFGYSVALSGDTLAVGAIGEASDGSSPLNNSLSGAGAAYVFTRSNTTWAPQAYIKASDPAPASDDNFGWSLALFDDTLVVGAPGRNTYTGAGYLYTRSSGTWSQLAYFLASNPDVNDSFGASLALTDDMLAVGAPGEASNATGIDGNQNDTSMNNAGAVYTFQ
jgi:trimeric autotransporter adhesin